MMCGMDEVKSRSAEVTTARHARGFKPKEEVHARKDVRSHTMLGRQVGRTVSQPKGMMQSR